MKTKLPLYAALLLLTQCSKCKQDDPVPDPPKDPLSLLPPETQSGTGNIGCLINGKAYIGTAPTLARGDWMSPTRFAIPLGGNLNGQRNAQGIAIVSALNGQLQDNQTFSIISAATPFPIFTPGKNQFIISAGGDIPCYYSGNYVKTGQVELVKFDGYLRIASGRFAFTLYEPGGCDTLHVTNGRFDVKF